MIPMFLRLRASSDRSESGRRSVNLWIPLFPVWILLLPLVLLLLIFWLIIRLLGNVSPDSLRLARLVSAGTEVLWRINGLRIRIRSGESRFVLHF